MAAALLASSKSSGHLVHLLLSFGLAGLFLVSIVDSSFVPLPVPGVTDIMIIVMAAQQANLFLLVGDQPRRAQRSAAIYPTKSRTPAASHSSKSTFRSASSNA